MCKASQNEAAVCGKKLITPDERCETDSLLSVLPERKKKTRLLFRVPMVVLVCTCMIFSNERKEINNLHTRDHKWTYSI